MALGTPYLNDTLLFNAPTAVSWSLIPEPDADQAQINAAVNDVIWRATSRVDTYCRMPLRATADTEYLNGPGMPQCNIDRDTGNGVLQMKRWPVTEVLAIQVSPSRSFPRVWSPVPSGLWDIRHPLIYSGDSASATAPDGGWTIDVAPGYIGHARTRRGEKRVQVCYVNGWPHTSLTQQAPAGASTLSVDDVTGWAGASGFCYDGAGTEPVAVASVSATTPFTLPNNAGTAQAGPGIITLTAPLEYEHPAGTLVSALPPAVIEATIYAACVQALDAGIDALAVQSIGGERVSSDAAAKDILTELELTLDNFRRVM